MHSDEQLDALYMLVLLRSLRERAHQAELAGQFDIARELYGYLKDYKKTERRARAQHRHLPSISADAEMLASQLAQKGVTLSYYCCYCGALLTIGTTSPEIPNHCPQCGVRIDAIDFEKMIQNVLLS
jgi:DNA-directed RNA polymerase subunit RPC12/RpoP